VARCEPTAAHVLKTRTSLRPPHFPHGVTPKVVFFLFASSGAACAGGKPVNFDVESSVSAMKTLDALEKKYPSAMGDAVGETVGEPQEFLDFEPVTGALRRR